MSVHELTPGFRDGVGYFTVESTGTLPFDRMVNLPISGTIRLSWWQQIWQTAPPSFEMNVAVAPSRVIAGMRDFARNALSGAILGEGDPAEAVAADLYVKGDIPKY